MADIFEPKGALKLCGKCFPNFTFDIEILAKEGYLRVTSPETCIWLKSKTSLAEYFKWAGKGAKKVPKGFWAPIEKAFGIKRHTLSRLASRNGNDFKLDECMDFNKIKSLIYASRTNKKRLMAEKKLYGWIKSLVLMTDGEDAEIRHLIIEKIKELVNHLDKITDKNDVNAA